MFDKIKLFFNKKKKEQSIDVYLLVSTRHISGGLSISYPSIDGTRSMLELLSKFPIRKSISGKYIYKPIGLIYEAEVKQ